MEEGGRSVFFQSVSPTRKKKVFPSVYWSNVTAEIISLILTIININTISD